MQNAALNAIFLAAAMALALPAGAQTTAPPAAADHAGASAKGQAAKLAAADRTFMTKAAGAGLYEVEVSRLAMERASDAGVKDFAQMLVTDHSAANQELMALAQARGLQLPSDMPAEKRKAIDRLSKSKQFDTDYVRMVGVKDHQSDITLFEKAGRSVKDAEVRDWATQKLPILRKHLTQGQALQPGRKDNASASKAGH